MRKVNNHAVIGAFLLCAAISVDSSTICTTKQVVEATMATNTAAAILYSIMARAKAKRLNPYQRIEEI